MASATFTIQSETLRLEALDRAVRVNLAAGGHEKTSETVERAKAYETFLRGE